MPSALCPLPSALCLLPSAFGSDGKTGSNKGDAAMAEDRTQAPSRRRRQQAREQGLAAKSPDLTAAVGLLAAVALVGSLGGGLAAGFVGLIRGSLAIDPALGGDPAAVSASIWRAAGAVFGPTAMIVGGTAAAMVAAHLIQTGGLWNPARLAPDPARLVPKFGGEGPDRGPGAAARRGVWGLIRSLAILIVAGWISWTEAPRLAGLAGLEATALGPSAGSVVLRLAFGVGMASLGLGLVDYAMAWRRVEAQLRQTPEEHKAEAKDAEGDPEVRSRRQRLARSRRDDPARAVAAGGVALLVTEAGPGRRGLAILLGGDPPPGQVSVRMVARGPSAIMLRRAADRAGLPRTEAPALARWFADAAAPVRAQAPSSGRIPALPVELGEQLAGLWPTRPMGR